MTPKGHWRTRPHPARAAPRRNQRAAVAVSRWKEEEFRESTQERPGAERRVEVSSGSGCGPLGVCDPGVGCSRGRLG